MERRLTPAEVEAEIDAITFMMAKIVVLHLALIFASALLFYAVRCRRPHSSREVGANKRQSMLERLLRLEKPSDGLFSCEELGNSLGRTISGFIIVVLCMPILASTIILTWGWIVAIANRWTYKQGFWTVAYVLAFMENRVYHLNAAGDSGEMVLLACGLLGVIQVNFILTMVSVTRLASDLTGHFGKSFCVTLVIVFLVLPLAFTLCFALLAVGLAYIEEARYPDAFLWLMNFATVGGNFNFVQFDMRLESTLGTSLVAFVACLCLSIDGLIIGLLGGLPFLRQIMIFLEGEDSVEEIIKLEQIEQMDKGEYDKCKAEADQLKIENSKIQDDLLSQGILIEELNNKLRQHEGQNAAQVQNLVQMVLDKESEIEELRKQVGMLKAELGGDEQRLQADHDPFANTAFLSQMHAKVATERALKILVG